jgi:energy-coupling factor transporter ATP-binding protein EcfA2
MTVHLPIIRRVQVTGYELYPGKARKGIDWDVQKGVSVVAGVNGLGKTTLLNILFRMLAGPRDWRIDEGPLGNLDRSLRSLRDTSYFRSRVLDGAAKAVARIELSLGGTRMVVARRLRDLKIVELTVDSRPAATTEDVYTAAILAASGLASDFDFHLILRLLVFYMEDRRPLLWDRSAQDEVLRALVYPKDAAAQVAELANTVQSLDSEFRNQRVHLNRQIAALQAAEAATAADAAAVSQFNSTKTRARAARERVASIAENLALADAERLRVRTALERAKLRHEEIRRAHHDLRQRFFSSLYPKIGEVGRYLLVTLEGGAGCLVCGNVDADASARLERCVADGNCPLCDAPADRQDVRPAKSTAAEARRLAELEDQRTEADNERSALDAALQGARDRYYELYEEQLAADAERIEIERELELLGQALPPPDEEIEALRRVVDDLRRKQNALRRRREQEEVKLREQLAVGRKAVLGVAETIAAQFRKNAAAFLAEDCEITVVQEDRKFGDETGSFRMPRFTVKLTSGVFKSQPQPRRASTEVSESQKEFIDLAFRLAILQATMARRPSMMVIETPEASLDSIFIARAGRLLARYAAGGGTVGNRLIASSNLNKEDMIPALFGLASEEEYVAWWSDRRRKSQPPGSSAAIPLAERPDRILNLLDVAAENRAVEENKDGYLLRYRRALDPVWSHPPSTIAGRTRRRATR